MGVSWRLTAKLGAGQMERGRRSSGPLNNLLTCFFAGWSLGRAKWGRGLKVGVSDSRAAGVRDWEHQPQAAPAAAPLAHLLSCCPEGRALSHARPLLFAAHGINWDSAELRAGPQAAWHDSCPGARGWACALLGTASSLHWEESPHPLHIRAQLLQWEGAFVLGDQNLPSTLPPAASSTPEAFLGGPTRLW